MNAFAYVCMRAFAVTMGAEDLIKEEGMGEDDSQKVSLSRKAPFFLLLV